MEIKAHCIYTLSIASPVVTIVYTDPTQTSYTVNIDDSVTFQCVATGIPPPTITWYRNGTELNSSNSRVTFGTHYVSTELDIDEEIAYSVNRTLTLWMSKDEDSGMYECKARNEAILGEDSVEFELIVQSKFSAYSNGYLLYTHFPSM